MDHAIVHRMNVRHVVAAALLATSAHAALDPALAHGLLAVLEFRNKLVAKDREAFDTGYFADVVRARALKELPEVRVITRENLMVLLAASGKKLADCEGECEVDTGRRIGADLVISGELLRVGSSFKLNLRMHETASGQLLSGELASGKTVDELDANTVAAVKSLLEPLRSLVRAPAPAQVTPAQQPAPVQQAAVQPPPVQRLASDGTPFLDAPRSLTTYRGQNGVHLRLRCAPGATDGALYGDVVYTDDSSPCRAAVHAGILGAQGGVVTVELRAGQSSFAGVYRNGFTSSSYAAWPGSFVFVGAGAPAAAGSGPPPSNAVNSRGRNGERFTFSCPAGPVSGFVWGDGTYTDDSSICKAAIHAGKLATGQAGAVTIEIRPGQSRYAGATRNGITSSAYGSFSGSFVFP